jgi:hypothetical protein
MFAFSKNPLGKALNTKVEKTVKQITKREQSLLDGHCCYGRLPDILGLGVRTCCSSEAKLVDETGQDILSANALSSQKG